MNLHLLRTFAAVIHHNSFSKAAEAAHISQPAVSKAVRELEHQLGVSLLERRAAQIRLTEAGEVLYEHARAIFALEQAAVADIRGLQELEHGHLTIGASMTIATYLMPPLIARFLNRYPGVDVRVVSANTDAIVADLLRYEIDLAFVEGPVSDERVHVEHWRNDELVVLASPYHSLATRTRVEPHELVDERWVVREKGSGTRAVTESRLQEIGIEPNRLLEVNSTGAVVESVAADLGLAMTSMEAARDQIANQRVCVLNLPGRPFLRPLYQLNLQGRPYGPVARAFADMQRNNG